MRRKGLHVGIVKGSLSLWRVCKVKFSQRNNVVKFPSFSVGFNGHSGLKFFHHNPGKKFLAATHNQWGGVGIEIVLEPPPDNRADSLSEVLLTFIFVTLVPTGNPIYLLTPLSSERACVPNSPSKLWTLNGYFVVLEPLMNARLFNTKGFSNSVVSISQSAQANKTLIMRLGLIVTHYAIVAAYTDCSRNKLTDW